MKFTLFSRKSITNIGLSVLLIYGFGFYNSWDRLIKDTKGIWFPNGNVSTKYDALALNKWSLCLVSKKYLEFRYDLSNLTSATKETARRCLLSSVDIQSKEGMDFLGRIQKNINSKK